MHTPYVWAVAGLFLPALLAQGIDPAGRVHPQAGPLANVAVLSVPALDRGTIANEDAQRVVNGQPARYAMPFAVQANPTTHGTWEVLDATWSLWRLRIQAPDANHINLGFRQFTLPPSGRLMVYSSDYSDIVRPFDAADHSPSGQLWTPVVQTAEIVAELYVQTAQRPAVGLDLVHVGSGYRFFGAGPTAVGIDGSGPCQIDVACAQGAPWQNEVRSVGALSSGGSIFCTGFMVNNTAQDLRNYFMTANHCGVTAGAAPSLVVYWNYQTSGCASGSYTLSQFNTGSVLRATFATSDFTLLELNSPPNSAWGVSYAGWNRNVADAQNATGIHHPSGDVKKISFEYQGTATTSYGGGASPGNGSHVLLVDWDLGVTEPGSSGSPLFDQNHRVIGQLHGGGSACGNNLSDWYGKFAFSWNGGGSAGSRLSNWLDPLGTGATTLDTLVPQLAATLSSGVGCYSSRASFSQTFVANSFDLGGSAAAPATVAFVPTSNGFTIQAGASAWFAPTAANLALPNDGFATLPLPFVFPFPGGSTNVVRMVSNGFVWLNGTSTDVDNTPTFVELANSAARLAPRWMDLNPAAGGSTHFDVDPSGNAVYLTWAGVPATTSPLAAGNSVQVVLRSNGAIEYRYGLVGNQASTAVVGWSRGATLFPTNTDISVAMPFSVGLDLNPLAWTAVGRPITGTTQVLNLGNISSPATSIGIVLLGFTPNAAGVDLGFLGAPGCFLYLQVVSSAALPIASNPQPWSLAIPNTPSLAGAAIYTQGGLLQAGVNAFGLLTSNMVKLAIGTF